MNSKLRSVFAGTIVVFLLLAIHFGRPSRGGLWLRTFYESLHVPFFGIIAVCIFVVTPSRWGTGKRLILVAAMVISLSVLSEAAQIPTNRDASLTDLVADWLGAAGFIALALAFCRRFALADVRTRYLAILGVVLLAWPLLPLAKVSVAYVERALIVPSLVNFDSAVSSTFIHVQNARLTKRRNDASGSTAAEIVLQDGPWPGITLQDLWPDWTPYTTLIIEIENPESVDLNLHVRVDDREHQRSEQRYADRFNRKINLEPGLQTIRIQLADVESAPDKRQMNMAEIHRLIVFATRRESGRRFVLHQVRLE